MPLALQSTSPSASRAAPATAPAILFVDDELPILVTLKRRLRGRYRIQTALDGEHALRVVEEKGPFAVVVTDMRMPGADGMTFLCELRKRAPSTARIMLTGDQDPRTAIDAVNRGHVFRFLQKPCSAEDVAEAIDAAVREHEFRHAYERVAADLIYKFQEEFRTPLNHIIDFASVLEAGGSPTDAVREYAAYIRQSGESLLAVTDGVITLAAISEGRCQVRPTRVPPSKLIAIMRELYAEAALGQEIRLSFAVDDSLAEMDVDMRLATLALGALVSNAMKFTPRGGRVTVEFRPGRGADEQCVIAVTDTGPGMPVTRLADIERGSNATAGDGALPTDNGGLGLGIPLARAIASLHGGSLEVASPAEGGVMARLVFGRPANQAG